MKRGSVVVDVAIDQGGCFETSRATTHTDPIYFVDNVLHYCVSNMPAAVPHTSTFALTNATFPYLLELANKGVERACARAPGPLRGRQYMAWRGHSRWRGGIPEPSLQTVLNAMPLTHLSQEEALFRDTVRRFARERIAPLVRGMDEAAALDPEPAARIVRTRTHGDRDSRKIRRTRREFLSVRAGHRRSIGRRSGGRRRGRCSEHHRQ